LEFWIIVGSKLDSIDNKWIDTSNALYTKYIDGIYKCRTYNERC
jgi:hypothetical protein